jgi:hypothetical protein
MIGLDEAERWRAPRLSQPRDLAHETFHVLLVDDNLAEAIQTADVVGQGSIGRFTVSRVATFAAAAERLRSVRYDASCSIWPCPIARAWTR